MPRRGENIYKRKDGRWEARYIHHYENGKAKYRYIYGSSYTEVKAKKFAAQSEPECTKIPAAKQLITFKTLALLWLGSIRTSVKESTYTRYFRIVDTYLFPLIGEQAMAKSEQSDLNNLTEVLLDSGGVNHTKLASKTVTDILCVFKSIIKYGKEHGYPVPNLNALKYPQKSPKSVKILNEENRIKIERELLHTTDLTGLGIVFTLFTGVRLGELCGLRWEDIDFSASIVTIRRTVERISDLDPLSKNRTKIVISEPKTKSSARIIPLPDFLLSYLRERKTDNDCYILTGSSKYIEPHQFYIRYKRYLRNNFLEDYTFHALRHTFATRCVELGFDTKSLSEILGHSSITTTLSLYVHPTIQQKKRQMERLTPELLLAVKKVVI